MKVLHSKRGPESAECLDKEKKIFFFVSKDQNQKKIQNKEGRKDVSYIPGCFNEDDGRGEPEIHSDERGGVTAEEDDGGPDEGERAEPRREQLQERLREQRQVEC